QVTVNSPTTTTANLTPTTNLAKSRRRKK
ncbi:unnamed protein product, partial [Adineta steineri]